MSDQIVSSIKTLDWQAFINRGLQYGDGIFETMRLVNGHIPLWRFHWQRLVQSAKVLQLSHPKEAEILAQIQQLSDLAETSQSIIKLTLFRKSQGRGYLAQHKDSDWILQSSTFLQTKNIPVHVGWAELKLAEQPVLAGIKHLNRLEQVFLARELQVSGFDELLVCSPSGHVIEAVSQNLVFYKGDKLFTPKTNRCGVAGVGLAWLKSHFDVKEINIQTEDLNGFDGMSLINSVRGVTAVASIDAVKKLSPKSPLHDRINRLLDDF